MGIAFETAIQALHNWGVVDPPRGAIAKALIDLAKAGEGPGASLRSRSRGVLQTDS